MSSSPTGEVRGLDNVGPAAYLAETEQMAGSIVIQPSRTRDVVIGAAGTIGTLTNSYLLFDALESSGASDLVVGMSIATVGASVVAQACSYGPLVEQYLLNHHIPAKAAKAASAAVSFLTIGGEVAGMEMAARGSVSFWSLGSALGGALLSYVFTGKRAVQQSTAFEGKQRFMLAYEESERARRATRNDQLSELFVQLSGQGDSLAEQMYEWVGAYPEARLMPLDEQWNTYVLPGRESSWGGRFDCIKLRAKLRNEFGESLGFEHLQDAINRQPGLMSWDSFFHKTTRAFPEHADRLKEWRTEARSLFAASRQARLA